MASELALGQSRLGFCTSGKVGLLSQYSHWIVGPQNMAVAVEMSRICFFYFTRIKAL